MLRVIISFVIFLIQENIMNQLTNGITRNEWISLHEIITHGSSYPTIQEELVAE